MNIIAVDWGKDFRKRSAYRAELSSRTITRLPFDGRLSSLIEYTSTLSSPTLIGIDAAIGLPSTLWKSLSKTSPITPTHFVNFLLSGSLPDDFFEPISTPEDWKPSRPFIRPPPGPWSLNEYEDASNNGIRRSIDISLNANPIFVMSGMPGTVGSGTQMLWNELIKFKHHSAFKVWPFQGSLENLLNSDTPVIAEIYPKACYGIAISEALPAPLLSIAKTKAPARETAITQMMESPWIQKYKVKINDLEPALLNEDDFDALISAAALLRVFLDDAPIEIPDTIDTVSEGSVLGAACINNIRQRITTPPINRPAKKKVISKREITHKCPIPGCAHVFHNSRGGWDSHVASVRRHPRWHTAIVDPTQRKALFKKEFADWFSS